MAAAVAAGTAAVMVAAAAAEGAPLPRAEPLVLLLASDGVWDNWRFEEVAAFAAEGGRLARARERASAAALVGELMAENKRRADANFGDSADNMTLLAVVCFPPSA